MTADRLESDEPVDELPEDQVTVALADLRRRLPRSGDKARAPEFFGIVDEADLPQRTGEASARCRSARLQSVT